MIPLLKWELAKVAVVENVLGGEQAEGQAGCGSEVGREVRRLGVLLSCSVLTSSAIFEVSRVFVQPLGRL